MQARIETLVNALRNELVEIQLLKKPIELEEENKRNTDFKFINNALENVICCETCFELGDFYVETLKNSPARKGLSNEDLKQFDAIIAGKEAERAAKKNEVEQKFFLVEKDCIAYFKDHGTTIAFAAKKSTFRMFAFGGIDLVSSPSISPTSSPESSEKPNSPLAAPGQRN